MMFSFAFTQISISGKWEQLKGLDGGDMHFVYSTDDNILFASHGFGGVWRSEDEGKTWELIQQKDFVDICFYSMTERDGILYAGANKGIWKSYDRGKTWKRILTGIGDIDDGRYSVVSITKIGEKLFFSTVVEKSYRVRKKFGESKVFYFSNDTEVREFPLPEECKYEVVISGRYPYLFASSLHSGLYVYSFENKKWEKILNEKTTKVFVDRDFNIYTGTFGNWYFIGEKEKYGWKWHQIKISPEDFIRKPRHLRNSTKAKKTPLPVGKEKNFQTFFYFIVPDPVNRNYLWFGAGGIGGFYSLSARGEGLSFVGTCFYKDGKVRNINISSRNFSPTIAFIKGKTIQTEYGEITKIALIPQGGKGCISKTEDGGKTWKHSYDGIYGDTINAINIIRKGILKGCIIVTAVSGIEVATENGDKWLPDIDFQIGPELKGRHSKREDKEGFSLPGYSWCAISPERKIKGKYDLLISTGYPVPSKESTGDGVFAFSFSSLKNPPILREKILSGPHYEMEIVDGKLYAGNMDGGVDILDLESFQKKKIEMEGAGNLVRYYDDKIFIATYNFKGLRKERGKIFYPGDMWRAMGNEGKVYFYDREEGILREVFEKYVINFSVNNGEFVGLTPSSIVYKKNIFSNDKIEVPLNEKFCDMAVDWEDEVIFLANFSVKKPGIFWADLNEIKRGKITVREFSDGLLTNWVRNIVYYNGYLFAGTEGHSVWRAKVKVLR